MQRKKRNIIISTLLSILILVGISVYILYFLPLPDSIIGQRANETTKIYDRNGVLLYEILQPDTGRKTFLPFEKIPHQFIQATLASEDSNYYSHWGVDFGAIIRAIWQNVQSDDIISGASTIPQQLIKNLLGTTRDRSLQNKIGESLYALRISQIQSKDVILEQYINTVYYGNMSYGAETAALTYFGKHLYDLDLAETTILAGIPKNPTLYNPLSHIDDAKERQKEVLNRMVQEQYIDQKTMDETEKEPLCFKSKQQQLRAPHFVLWLIEELEKEIGKELLLYGGLKIYTTIDITLQEKIEQIITHHIDVLADKNVSNGSAFIIDSVGNIVAMVGSKNFYDTSIDGQVNIVFRKRQPGSTFKPITYIATLLKGWTPATTILDLPTKFMTEEGTPYTPQNYDMDYHGMVTVRDALANSYNIPAVKALEFAGTSAVLTLAKQLGLDSLTKDSDYYGLALTLGNGEVRLFDLVHAFSVFANGGVKKPIHALSKIEPAVDMAVAQKEQRLLPEAETYLITHILQDNNARISSFGEYSSLNIPHIAVKTGTSRNFKDNWTIGYSPAFTIGVWVGNNSASSMQNVSGVEGAGPIFHDIAKLMIEQYGNLPFQKPSSVIEKEICLPSGKLPTPYCPQKRLEVFVKGTEPTEQDNLWKEEQGEIVLSVDPPLIPWAKKRGYRVAKTTAQTNYLQIQNPSNHDEFFLNPDVPQQYQTIALRAVYSEDITTIEWFLNGEKIGTGSEISWNLQEGTFIITAKSGPIQESISIIVHKQPSS